MKAVKTRKKLVIRKKEKEIGQNRITKIDTKGRSKRREVPPFLKRVMWDLGEQRPKVRSRITERTI